MKKIAVHILVLSFLTIVCACTKKPYIAHAGGCTKEGHLYSNSLEAVRNALKHRMSYIELDLSLTSDSQLVAWHDWSFEWDYVPTHDQFMARKIYDAFTPIDFSRLDSILRKNRRLSLVTDKISDPDIIDRWLQPYKERVWVECFSDDDYLALQEMGYNVLASRVPPLMADSPALIRNYTFNRFQCTDLSDRDGDVFALFGLEISRSMADSLLAADERIQFVYIDHYE